MSLQTLKVTAHVAVLPAASVALQTMVYDPNGKTVPDACCVDGNSSTVGLIPELSLAVGTDQNTNAPLAPAVLTS